MQEITITTFIDFVTATPGAKVSVVRDARRLYDEGYRQMRDPYKRLRSGIKQTIRDGKPPSSLRSIDPPDDMVEHWSACIDGLCKFMGRRKIMEVVRPKILPWISNGLSVKVNPELFVNNGGERQAIKLYLKAPKPTKIHLNTALYLMRQAIVGSIGVGILDLRRGKLHTPPVPTYCAALLPGQAAEFMEIWRQLGPTGQQAASS